MKRFILERFEDATGVSGVGIVAEGVQFSDGRCSMRWITPKGPSSTAMYDSVRDLSKIHGHGGSTVVVWVDK